MKNRYIHTILLFAVAVLLSFCGQKDISATAEREAPEWISSRPINPSYYIGIGSVSKRTEPVEYAAVAKKNALNDLVSEIRVTVKSQSFLNTMQVNKQVQEEFNSTIATSSDEEIEGFEVVDSYETETDYWVYYRLSRAKHEMIRQEKKNAVMQVASDYLTKARSARDAADINTAADLYLRGLFEMKEYWNDVNRWMTEGGEIYLDNTLFQEFRDMINAIELTSDLDKIMLDAGNKFSSNVNVTAIYKGSPVSALQLEYTYDNGRYRNTIPGRTDASGVLRVRIDDADLTNASNQFEVVVDANDLKPGDLDRKLIDPLLEGIRSRTLVLPIEAELPGVWFNVSESNLGEALGTERLADPLREKLGEKGFNFTTSPEAADFLITLEADTRQGGTSQGFHVAYLDLKYTVRDREGRTLLQSSENNIKGLQLNFEAAGLEAYKKAVKRIEREISDNILDAIF